jgi:aminoglycoside phosphotransferase (APT) family kinase protein
VTSTPDEVLHTRSGAELRLGRGIVVKRHRRGTEARLLAARLTAAGVVPELLAPLVGTVEVDGQGRCVTRWPRVPVLAADDPIPWGEWGRLLARLHRTPLVGPLRLLPVADPWARLDRALTALDGTVGVTDPASASLLHEVAAALPREPATSRMLVHGDVHAGQLGLTHHGWVLIDVDDLGLGDPAWDLARPAGYWAAGLLPDDGWHAFLAGYTTGAGPAVDPGDPWVRLDTPARAAVITAAAHALEPGSPTADAREALLSACAAMPRSVP